MLSRELSAKVSKKFIGNFNSCEITLSSLIKRKLYDRWRYEISLLVYVEKYSARNFVSPRGHVISSISLFTLN